ncbi:MAG: hypothetical protein QME64_12855, partial [bacterium]|nr:hypothetical protein [bacterium]
AVPIEEKKFFEILVEKLEQELSPTLTQSQVQKALNRALENFKAESETFELEINLLTHPAYSGGLTGKYKGRIHQRSKKGKYYSKRYAKPKNPRTSAQIKTRDDFNQASEAYKNESESVRDLWRNEARKLQMTSRSLYMQQYIKLLNQGTTPPSPFLP